MFRLKQVVNCLALGFLVTAMGCLSKPVSHGEGRVVFIVADQETWSALESPLRTAFERSLHTPIEEFLFALKWITPENFKNIATNKNIVLVGILGAEGEISRKVSNMLSAGVRNRVEDGSAYVFPKEDAWAKNQLLLVLAGTSTEQLLTKLVENKDYLYALFYNKLMADTKKIMFQTLEQTELSDDLLDKYGWTVRIQHDYFVNIQRLDANFVMLRRSLPGRERWLFVNWIEDGDPALINEKWIVNRRDFLTTKFYKGDSVYQNETNNFRRVTEVEFANRPAVLIEGLWINEKDLAKSTGGPFRNYTFYDEESRRIYMIDIAVWFPAGDKEPFLRQLEIMARSFKTDEDIKKYTNKEVR